MQHLPKCGLLRFRLEHEVRAYNLLRIYLPLIGQWRQTHTNTGNWSSALKSESSAGVVLVSDSPNVQRASFIRTSLWRETRFLAGPRWGDVFVGGWPAASTWRWHETKPPVLGSLSCYPPSPLHPHQPLLSTRVLGKWLTLASGKWRRRLRARPFGHDEEIDVGDLHRKCPINASRWWIFTFIKMMETPEASVSDFCFAMMDVLFASI